MPATLGADATAEGAEAAATAAARPHRPRARRWRDKQRDAEANPGEEGMQMSNHDIAALATHAHEAGCAHWVLHVPVFGSAGVNIV